MEETAANKILEDTKQLRVTARNISMLAEAFQETGNEIVANKLRHHVAMINNCAKWISKSVLECFVEKE